MKGLLHQLLYSVLTAWFRIRHIYVIWYSVLNQKSKRAFQANKPTLSSLQKRLVDDLARDGIAVTHLNELFPEGHELDKYFSFVTSRDKTKPQHNKPFLTLLFDENAPLDVKSSFARFSLHPTVLSVVNSYFKLHAKLLYVHLAKVLPVLQGSAPQASQAWHRDPEDKKLCKVFLYLTDVDKGAGPFTYVRKSHSGGVYADKFPQRPPVGAYPHIDEAIETWIIKQKKEYMGKKGTVIFCDTTGLHRGGYATEKERVMYTTSFVTEASLYKKRFTLELSPEQATDNVAARDVLTWTPKGISSKLFYRYKFLFRY